MLAFGVLGYVERGLWKRLLGSWEVNYGEPFLVNIGGARGSPWLCLKVKHFQRIRALPGYLLLEENRGLRQAAKASRELKFISTSVWLRWPSWHHQQAESSKSSLFMGNSETRWSVCDKMTFQISNVIEFWFHTQRLVSVPSLVICLLFCSAAKSSLPPSLLISRCTF